MAREVRDAVIVVRARVVLVVGVVCVLVAGGCASARPGWDAGHLPALRDGPVGQRATVAGMAFSPDGQLLAAADGRAGTVTIWQLNAPGGPRQAGRLSFIAGSKHAGVARDGGASADTRADVDSVRFTSSGRVLAVYVFQQFGLAQASVSFWDLADPGHPTQLGQLPEISPAGSAGIGFSPTGALLAVRGYDSATTTLWDTTSFAHPRRLGGFTADMGAGALSISPDPASPHPTSPDPAVVAVGGPGGSTLWDIRNPADPHQRGPVLGPLVVCVPATIGCANRQGSDNLDSVRISPDGHTLAIGGCDGYILTYDITNPDTPHPTGRLTAHTTNRDESCVEGLAFSPDSQLLAAADIEGTTTLWTMSGPDQPTRLGQPFGGQHSGSGYSVAFSPDGDLLATGGGADSTIELWDIHSPDTPRALTDPPSSNPPQPTPQPAREPPGEGHPHAAEAGISGIDLSTPITTQRLAWLTTHPRELSAEGIHAQPRLIGRYISVGGHEKQDRDLSRGEVAAILTSGHSLAVFQRALGNGPRNWLEPNRETGHAIGDNAVANAHTVGLPPGMQLFLDIENIDPHASHAAIADYCIAWADQVRAAGYTTGLYAGLGMGSHYGLTGDEFDGLAFDGYWKPGNIELPVPTTHGYAAVQHHPPAFDLHISPEQDPAFLIDADHTQTDTQEHAITVLSR